MKRKLYPIGIQTFEEIRRCDNLYVDKTAYVYQMTHTDGKFYFLSRPRRFGKSLFVSTLKSYFEGRKDLFTGLAMEQLEHEWATYPVLHFSLAGGKHMNREELVEYLNYILSENELDHGVSCTMRSPNLRLLNLINTVYRKTGKQVVVLIDEYDAPLLDVVHNDANQLDELRNVMRNFYSPLKDCEPKLRFVFMTGITKFSQLSIFSELNNIRNVSMDPHYAAVCGITTDELTTQMSLDIDLLAEHLGQSREATIDDLKQHYDGYHFCWPSPDVFNPYSLLNCMADGQFGAYWFGSGTPTFLINMMRKFKVQPSDLKHLRAKASSFDAATENMPSATPLLYQSGYITIKGYDNTNNVFTLDIPNKEIIVGLYDSLLPGYLENEVDEGKVTIADIAHLIENDNINEALQLLADFIKTVPYCDNTHYEGHYQQLFYIMFTLLTSYRIAVEQRTAKGRIDITLETQSTIYVMELKFDKTPQEALTQINEKHYADAFQLSQKKVVKVGLNFALKEGINTLEWVTE